MPRWRRPARAGRVPDRESPPPPSAHRRTADGSSARSCSRASPHAGARGGSGDRGCPGGGWGRRNSACSPYDGLWGERVPRPEQDRARLREPVGDRVHARATPVRVGAARELLAGELAVHLCHLLGEWIVAGAARVTRDARIGLDGAPNVLYRRANAHLRLGGDPPLHFLCQPPEKLLLVIEKHAVAERPVAWAE